METARKAYPIIVLCHVMEVSRSSYYAWRKREKSASQKENDRLMSVVKEIHRQCKGSYGTRRIAKELNSRGETCGRARSRTLMMLAGVTVRHRLKYKVTTDSRHDHPIAPNLLNQQFEVETPNKVWVSDITYIWTREGWLYLSVVIDLFSRQVVGWSLSKRIDKKLTMDSLRMAIWRRLPNPNLIFHSDRGCQYCSSEFQQMIRCHQMICSMSRKGNCWDNAVSESFFGSLKNERIFGSDYKTREEARRDIIDYIEMFYNSRRLHSYLGYLSPQSFEKMQVVNEAA
jgi:putative transposase